MNKTIGILAHVDAGKTTFSEQILYHTKAIKNRGRVDHQSSFLDSHEIEKLRGITVFAGQGYFSYMGSSYYLIDTPGHVDFSPEMERAVQVMDYAIIIISAVEGIEGHTETIWKLLQKHQVPVFFFINKLDRTGADVNRVIADMKLYFSEDIIELPSLAEGMVLDEEVIEFIAERDESLLEYYLENGYHAEKWLEKIQQMIIDGTIFPVFSGSALQDIGMKEFLDAFHLLTSTAYKSEGEFSGRAYKIRYDNSGTRVTFIKALSGRLKVRDEATYKIQEQIISEKITQIRKLNGSNFEIVPEVKAGELFAVTGLTRANIGDGIGAITDRNTYELVPTLRSNVVFEPHVNVKEALAYFNMLDAEDPSLKVTWEERLQQIHIHVMGTIQLEVLEQVVMERFGLKVLFEKPEIIYKETIKSEVIGYGHFEPLRHYAEVHLKLEPGERNSGILYDSKCHTDHLSVGLQNLVKQHVFESEHHGLLTGSALTDVKITLLTGKSHPKHTHGGDFREATFRAIRQGLEKAENVLLEPYYHFKIKVDIDQMGRVLSDVQAAHGRFEAPVTEGEKAVIIGQVPVATFMDYPMKLASFTKGRGSMTLTFSGYDQCHNEEEIIKRIAYDKGADPEYTSSSVFCAKGAGFSVNWDEAEKMMHLL
ncbi:TetM/TetW/TetO/TetS family tetracycline resistance ribosomal protection protein [Ornithinibacillus massiliensis]|uniref:TetM/TetW/TetO/TetS family tetracycline resistance ribosomal protection protein n=1 Tax=Ornithinibacillus massiliensis TaxID=1944633 RepID=A0ABS5MDB7_9BACI|nr:TetM/TetW/TetO/TetS family tetracycline resistance ribosomal protection protein [Ornithinibacillus massiliensis]MBS3680322.1 TetM/TetW/TetO/TetS family tetracycline resistance ribosomal protection protein [Ornithinibacillus massiliensis]